MQQSTRLKREAFPFAMLGIAAVLTISALGAAADPGTLRETTASWVRPHYWAGIIGLCVVGCRLVDAGIRHSPQSSADRVHLCSALKKFDKAVDSTPSACCLNRVILNKPKAVKVFQQLTLLRRFCARLWLTQNHKPELESTTG